MRFLDICWAAASKAARPVAVVEPEQLRKAREIVAEHHAAELLKLGFCRFRRGVCWVWACFFSTFSVFSGVSLFFSLFFHHVECFLTVFCMFSILFEWFVHSFTALRREEEKAVRKVKPRPARVAEEVHSEASEASSEDLKVRDRNNPFSAL